MEKIRIMIVNDSKAMRYFLEDAINSYSDCELVVTCVDGNSALNYLKIKKPDVILLDLEMPKMDGLTFLENVSKKSKNPTIVVSNYVNSDSKLANDAMNLGADDSLEIPSDKSRESFEKFRNLLHHKIIKSSLKSPNFLLHF